jgi:hypothetical protein
VSPHLRGHIRAYVERSLPGPVLRVFDQHLVACEVCRALADQERRIVAALQSDTGVPQSLRSALMGLADGARLEATPIPSAPARSRAHLAELSFGDRTPSHRARLATVAPTAPALHRSPMRAAVVASLAATASLAAAWGLTVVPLNPAVRGPERLPADVSSFGTSTFGQQVSTRPNPFITDRSIANTATIGGARLGASGEGGGFSLGGLAHRAENLAPAWTTTGTAVSDPLLTPVRLNVARSAQSGP